MLHILGYILAIFAAFFVIVLLIGLYRFVLSYDYNESLFETEITMIVKEPEKEASETKN